MGVVYLAQNKLMGRTEVLKVVSSHLINRRGVLDRFLAEIRNAARLHHPNIVTAYSALRLGESLVLAMEYVEGLDLAKLVKARGPLPVANACNYVHQAALGLQHAHEHGMVHRDIKPSNLMLARQGNRALIKVLDFGLAKVQSEGAVDGGLTHEGQMLGTPDYIAPEQISDARRADIRADIYSLGCTLYYLLTGGPPFQGTSLYDILQAHHSMDAKPLNLARPEVPVELAALVAKMMAKEPERRFQTPKEVAQALTPFFKKGNVASTGSKPEFSQAGRPEAKPATAGVGSVPTRPAAESPPAPEPSVTKPVETPRPEAMWKSLVDLDETEPAKEAAPAAASNRRPPWLWRAVAAGVLLLGFVALWGVLIKIWTPEGIIVLKGLPDQAMVLVDDKKATVHWPDGSGDAEITAAPGDRMVEVRTDGFTMEGRKVTVKRGGKAMLVVELEPLETSRPRKGDDRPVRQGVAEPPSPAPPATGAVVTAAPTPVPTRAAIPNPSPTILGDEKAGDAGRPDRAKTANSSVSPNRRPPEAEPVITNSIDMKLVLIPDGEFMMGSPDSDRDAQPDEKPLHLVRFNRSFRLGATEVTQGQYRAVTGENPSSRKGDRSDDLPVENVSWISAIAFCNKLSAKEGLTPYYESKTGGPLGGDGYRLPTEAEWEYACRAGSRFKFSFGDDETKVRDHGWFTGNFTGDWTHAVGQKLPNAFGLYDMHGNVWEWCWDKYDGRNYANEPVDNRVRHAKSADRVSRGGCWNDAPHLLRAAYRGGPWRGDRAGTQGFRVARGQSATDTGVLSKSTSERHSRNEPAHAEARQAARSPSRVAEVVSGKWRVEGNLLVQANATGVEGEIRLGDRSWSRYDLSFKVIGLQGLVAFHVNFHYKNSRDRCILEIGDDSVKNITYFSYVHNGKGSKLLDRRHPIELGREYDVRLKVRGPKVWIYLDGQELFDDVDVPLTAGRIALVTYTTAARFRDIAITTPEGKPLWNGPPDRLVDSDGKVLLEAR